MKKLLILICLYSINSFAAQIDLYALQNDEVKTGDIVSFKVQTEKSFESLLLYKNKKVGKILYVLDLTLEGENIYMRAILAPIEKEPTDKENLAKKKKPEDTFLINNLNYREEQIPPLKDFVVLPGPEVFLSEKTKKNIFLVVCFFLVVLVSLVSRKLFLKSKKKKRILLRKKKKLLMIQDAKTKEDFEKIYRNRKDILNDIEFDEKKLKEFIETINDVQYKKSCTPEELEKLKLKYMNFSKTARVSDGV